MAENNEWNGGVQCQVFNPGSSHKLAMFEEWPKLQYIP